MKRPIHLFLHFIFLGLFNGYFSSNPDSVMVQSPEDNGEKIGKIQVKDVLPKVSAVSEIPRNVVVKVMRPIVIGSEMFWKEVDSESFSRMPASSQYRDSWRYFRPSRLNMRRISEKGNEDMNTETPVSEDGFKIPGNNVKGNRRIIGGDTKPQMPEINLKGNRETNGGDNKPQMPEINFKGNRGVNGGDNKPKMPEINLQGNRRVNGGDNKPKMPEISLEENGGDNKPQMPESNLKGTGGINGGVDRSSIPDDRNTNNREILGGDSFHVFTESEETFFEDDHQTKPAGPAPNSPARISADSSFFAGIVNDFAFKLVENLNLESNFVISPLSIYIALSMCYLGSDGRTKAQIEQVLGMNDNGVHDEHLHKGIKDLISFIMEKTSGYELYSANGMFLGKNFTTEPSFQESIKNYFDAEIKNLDFRNPDLSREFINKWVSDNTGNMINSIINSPPPLQTRLLLLNAVFFKGIWKTQFPIHLTYTGKFHLLDGTDKEVRFMNLFDETFPVVRSDEHRHSFIKLPYEGDEVSMIIALPYTAREKPISSIRDQILCYMRDAMANTKLDTVAIPKFRLEHRISLIRPLQRMGITDIFNRNVINFRKMRKENDVYVSGLLHKSVIEIDEVGTTASASTDVMYVPLSYQNNTKFVADHPFAFYIIHEPTGLVLFYGKIFDFDAAPIAPNNRREEMRGRPRPSPNRRG